MYTSSSEDEDYKSQREALLEKQGDIIEDCKNFDVGDLADAEIISNDTEESDRCDTGNLAYR